jgi:hypothetical protein
VAGYDPEEPFTCHAKSCSSAASSEKNEWAKFAVLSRGGITTEHESAPYEVRHFPC